MNGILARPGASPQAGIIDDIKREDDQKGLEPDDDFTAFHRLVRHLVADGDRRAARAGHRARRTLDEMTPGAVLPPLLVLHQPRMNDACAICGAWSCTGNCWQNAPTPIGADARREALR
ncbi:hypothetical protein [Streptomyces sp. NPDC088261]|uniref:hypothetical protein n=1 Tax=Streptomyces sp. NPDC088261 TaxID=3365851 RepID=UPI003825AC2B